MLNRFTTFSITSLTAVAMTAIMIPPAFADASGYSHHGGGWGHMMFGSSMMIITLVLIVFLVVLVVRRFGSNPHQKEMTSSALGVLRERYARGEIDKDEYEERLAILSKP